MGYVRPMVRMKTSPSALALCLIAFACGTDTDPLSSASAGNSASATSGETTGASATAGTTTGVSGASDSTSGDSMTGMPTTGASVTTAVTTAGSGGAEGGKEVCDRYIQCVAVTDPTGLPDAQAGFGDQSSCWTGSQSDADLCVTACKAALKQAHEAFPNEDKCDACLSDADCAGGEHCLQGGCTTTNCGDGVVDDNEVCDSNAGCDLDCQGPAMCNPMSGYGCDGENVCQVNYGDSEYIAVCDMLFDTQTGSVGDGCGGLFGQQGCKPELACVSNEAGNFNCGLDGCCTPYCDVGGPPCPMGLMCVPYSSVMMDIPLEPSLSWLGVCIG